MKYKVGDIIRSKYDMIIDNIGEEQEKVKKGQYFLVIAYARRREYNYNDTGFYLVSQVSGFQSFWDEEKAPLEDNFYKEELEKTIKDLRDKYELPNR
jgi:hypothetical protein